MACVTFYVPVILHFISYLADVQHYAIWLEVVSDILYVMYSVIVKDLKLYLNTFHYYEKCVVIKNLPYNISKNPDTITLRFFLVTCSEICCEICMFTVQVEHES